MSETKNPKNTENIKFYTLDNVASWRYPQGENAVDVFIPKLQRGLVWNAARVEVFWDSLMRSIPVGCFSLAKVTDATKLQLKKEDANSKASYFLLDGQQRANAIALAYNPNFNEETKAILWLDLDYKKEEGDLCKYKFYLTNIRHPWGYNNINKNSETKEGKLSVGDWRAIVEEAELETNLHFERPKPYKLWPKAAKMPIPMYCLLKNFNNDEKSFWDKLYSNIANDKALKSLKSLNWFNLKGDSLKGWINLDENKSKKSEIFKAIQAIKNLKFPAFVCPDEMSGSQDEVSLYFKRINTQGVVPSAEEIQYSMAKSFWPKLWDIEEVAKEKMMPYRFAKIALEVFYMLEKKVWINDITDEEIRDLKKNREKDFSGFIGKLTDYSKYLDDILSSLTTYHRTLLAQNSKHIYKLLLFLICRFEKDALLGAIENKSNIFAGIATLIRWFAIKPAHEEKICKNIFESIKDLTVFDMLNIKKGIIKSINDNWLIVPISPENLNKAFSEKDVLEQNDEAWAKIENVFSYGSYGEEMLLFATKEYIDKFKYNPANYEKWAGDNRPWHYDHILPQDWVANKRTGAYRRICREYIDCIGNIAAIPSVINEEKGNKPPLEFYTDENELKELLLGIKVKDYTNNKNFLSDENISNLFVKNTKDRFLKIYSMWYNDLKIREIFNFDFNSLENDAKLKKIYQRREVFKKIEKAGFKDIYYVHGEFQFEVKEKEDLDWAYTSISVGKMVGDKYICITDNSDDKGRIEIGIRRLPSVSSGNWWQQWAYLEYNWGDEKLNAGFIIDKLKEIIEKNNGRE